jgi:hypothetical protein
MGTPLPPATPGPGLAAPLFTQARTETLSQFRAKVTAQGVDVVVAVNVDVDAPNAHGRNPRRVDRGQAACRNESTTAHAHAHVRSPEASPISIAQRRRTGSASAGHGWALAAQHVDALYAGGDHAVAELEE